MGGEVRSEVRLLLTYILKGHVGNALGLWCLLLVPRN